MSETKAVRLDKELMNTLAEKRQGFETPNECLKRLLNDKIGNCVRRNRFTNEVEDDES